MPRYDSGYKRLFSHPRLVQDLLTGFVQPEWLNDIDFDTLTPYKASFVTDDLRQRHDDSIWKLKFKDTWVYLYLLLEFQSSDDYFMANRMMTYLGLLYQDIIHSEGLQKGDCLPPVLPIVIYNGLSDWSGPLEMADLVLPAHPAMRFYTPHLSYFLLQENATPEAYCQEYPNNLVGHLIALERSTTPDEMRERIQRLHQQLQAPRYQTIRRSFAIWLSHLLRVKLKQDTIPEYQELNEVDAMLAERIQDWTIQWSQQGRQEGRQEGRREEAALLLNKLVGLKYGDLPDWAELKLQQASTEELEHWAERILFADNLEQLFD